MIWSEARSRYNWNIVERGVKHHNPNINPWSEANAIYLVGFFVI